MTPILNSKDHPFLCYLCGTYKEMEGLGQLEQHISDMRTNTENKDWLLVRRNILDMSRELKTSQNEYAIAKEDIDKSKFDWEYHGTIMYAIASIPLAIVTPYIGVPLLMDSTMRTGRMAFRSDPPIGLVGTIREAYQHIKTKK